MAFDEGVAERIRIAIARRSGVEEKKMFGGIAFMVSGHMALGVVDDELMVRVGPDAYGKVLARPHARPMDFTGKPLRGFVYVATPGFRTAAALKSWIDLAIAFARAQPAQSRKAAARAPRARARSGAARPKPAAKPPRRPASRLRRAHGS